MNLLRLQSPATHPGASCDERERNTAFAALAASLVIAVVIVVMAVLSIPEPGTVDASRLGLGSRNPGTGDGDGFGASVGNGSSTHGDGPGAGALGTGRGARASDRAGEAPRGSITGATPDPNAASGESLVAGKDEALPAFGFTPPTEQDQEFDTPTAVAAGAIDGYDGEGAAGKGGASGTASFGGIRTHAKSIVFILDFSSSIGHFGLEEALKQEFAKSIQGMAAEVRFGVILYGLSPDGSIASKRQRYLSDPPWTSGKPARIWEFDPREPGVGSPSFQRDVDVRIENRLIMPPGQLVEASPDNKRTAVSWVRSRRTGLPGVSGSSDIWDSLEAAIGMAPEAIFLLTDTTLEASKVQDAEQVLEALNGERRTRVHTITFNEDEHHEDPTLRALARDWGGLYRHVTVRP